MDTNMTALFVSIGLQKYLKAFIDQEVTLAGLVDLNDADLKELIPLIGPRNIMAKRIKQNAPSIQPEPTQSASHLHGYATPHFVDSLSATLGKLKKQRRELRLEISVLELKSEILRQNETATKREELLNSKITALEDTLILMDNKHNAEMKANGMEHENALREMENKCHSQLQSNFQERHETLCRLEDNHRAGLVARGRKHKNIMIGMEQKHRAAMAVKAKEHDGQLAVLQNAYHTLKATHEATLEKLAALELKIKSEEDVAQLLQFKDSIHGADLSSWSPAVPLTQWKGVTYEMGRVTELHLESMGGTGTPDLSKLPSTLVELVLSDNQFSGAPDLSCLPQTLTRLDLDGNQSSGCLTLPFLPPSLATLWLTGNKFTSIHIPANACRDSFPKFFFLSGNPWKTPLPSHPNWIAPLMR